jgi:lactoylglutathione lyase
MVKLNLIVLKTPDPTALKQQYELLGLQFEHHRHGDGPLHYSCEIDGLVLEIYPLPKSMSKADDSLRLGFAVDDLDKMLERLANSDWRIFSAPKETEWGRQVLLQDRDGRRVELTGK